MKIRMMAVAALALAAACGGSAPPGDGPAPQAAGEGLGGFTGTMPVGVGGGGPNVFALIGARERLSLTGAQVTELDSIGRIWSVVNDSVQRELRRRGERMPMETVRPLLLRMAENNDAANRAVEAVLNEDQRRVACTLQPPQAQGEVRRPPQDARTPGGRMGDRRGARRPGTGVDTVQVMRMRRGWPWCAPTAPAGRVR